MEKKHGQIFSAFLNKLFLLSGTSVWDVTYRSDQVMLACATSATDVSPLCSVWHDALVRLFKPRLSFLFSRS